MKAMKFSAFGGLDSLRRVELPCPQPCSGEVLVEVAALSVNPVDWKLRTGALRWLGPLRFSAIPCFDYAGRVSAIGSGVEAFGIDDRVFGLCRLGQAGAARAALLARPGALLAATPANVSDEEAAGVPLAGMTALQALNTPRPLMPGERVMIVGASGGVGHYAVQIAKALGAAVTAVCSTPNIDWVGTLGADRVLDYFRGDVDRPVPEFDRVFDAVSLGSFELWRRWLQPEGAYVTLLPRGDVLLQRLTLPCCARQQARSIFLKPEAGELERLAGWMAAGRLRTVIDRLFPFDELLTALQKSRAGHARGKIVVRVAPET
ncbi:NAD(P)-dependent alcohol dehydrogenase [Methylotetracoccus oryzae]|uniref:NAD(P)-dependent alcohol dehydrogenase n=1 Tax=Methylotetracoccus oryzae TaxID=1919059 RepID=UPI001117FA60|nr:NAD(P)-dependent alcohol dehydrogenase [Methylotetracoccus oryzae]